MPRWFYTALLYSLLPILLLRLYWRSIKAPAYRQHMAQRLGYVAEQAASASQPGIWLHAVSVGEVVAAAPLIRALLKANPAVAITVSTTTPTGADSVKRLFGASVYHCYAPFDLPCAIARFVRRRNPRLLIIMETELWPNLSHVCSRQGVRLLLANGRLSEKSQRGYQRFARLSSAMLKQFDMLAVQDQASARRFQQLGAAPERISVTGNLKYEIALSDAVRQRAEQLHPRRPCWIAASTHLTEEALILHCHQQLLRSHSNLLLIIAPRHPERFAPVAKRCRPMGLRCVQRSELSASASLRDVDSEVFLLDSLGELEQFLGCADVAFVGGSLVDRGGHNTLEAAVWGLPIITGSSDFNFRAVTQDLQAVAALEQVNDADALAAAVDRLLCDPAERARRGEAGASLLQQNRGALKQLLTLINALDGG